MPDIPTSKPSGAWATSGQETRNEAGQHGANAPSYNFGSDPADPAGTPGVPSRASAPGGGWFGNGYSASDPFVETPPGAAGVRVCQQRL